MGNDVESESIEVHDTTSKDSLLSLVYAKDDLTNLPTGDLTYLVSDKANPQVKQFILDNLMKDVSSQSMNTKVKGLSDDALLDLSRNIGESVQDYAERLNREIDVSKYLISQYQQSTHVSSESSSAAVSAQ